MEEKRDITLNLTKEQFDTVFYFIGYNNWDYNDVLVNSGWSIDNNDETEPLNDDTGEIEHQSVIEPCSSTTGATGGNDNSDTDNNGDINTVASDRQNQQLPVGQKCEHCFLSPCITTHYQSWLGRGSNASPRNSGLRKIRYRKYWNTLSNYGAWALPEYQEKKRIAFHRNRESDVWTIREIMPICVLNQVRSLYPNPVGQPFMGHRWQ